MNQVYWEIVTRDGTIVEIPPAGVDTVKKRWTTGQPVHTTSHGSIDPREIKYFRPTSRPFNQHELIEDASRAFSEPVYNPDGSMASRWVKTEVTQNEFATHYAKIPGYRKIGSEGGFVIVAFRLPVHQIDTRKTPYCTEEEIRKIKK